MTTLPATLPGFREHIRRRMAPLLLGVLVFLLAFGAVAWRLDQAPDVFTDEILYARAGVRLAHEGALVWDSGRPIHIHPPLYFLVEALLWQLPASPQAPLYAVGDIFATVYYARYLNAFLAGLTALLLYRIGWQLRGHGLGVLLAALFLLDPFGLRINRRAMLETLAGLLVLAGIAVLLRNIGETQARRLMQRAIVAGLLFGAALLTKELTFATLLAVLLFGLWERQRRRVLGDTDPQRTPPLLLALLTTVVAGVTYSLYPLWALLSGNWSGFMEVKWLSLRRLLGLVQLSGWNRPGVSLFDFAARRLADYGSTYLLLILGAVAVLWLLAKRRHDRAGRLLVVWGFVLYPFFGFVALFGSGNDQFFYLLLLAAIPLVGYTIAGGTLAENARSRQRRLLLVAVLLILVLPYGVFRWWSAYGVGSDNGYRQLSSFVNERLPAGVPLNATGDAIKFRYFFPDRPITAAATLDEAQSVGVHYFALAPKDAQSRYGRITPELASWIAAQGQQLYAVYGDSYGDILLYYVPYADGTAASLPEQNEARARQQSFGVARSAFIAPFLALLGLWTAAVGGMIVWLNRRAAVSSSRAVAIGEGDQAYSGRGGKE